MESLTNGSFAALGHGISDVDTGVLMKAARGEIYEAEIVSITKGRAGTPGELFPPPQYNPLFLKYGQQAQYCLHSRMSGRAD